ncbi:MAG: amidohydrolase, partial [Bacilli bacterium]|nr:amidohydrolase [Bacilli bacterium]
KFIFQHAEEVLPGGAREIIATGILDDVDEIFGLHIAGGSPVGSAASRIGAFTASSDTFQIKLRGKGTHGSTPDLGIDLVVVGSEIVSALQTIVSRSITPLQPAVITVGQFNIGTAANIIAHEGFMSGTVRAVNKEVRKLLEERIYAVVENIAKLYHAEVEINYIHGYSSVINEFNAYQTGVKAVKKVIGDEGYYDMPNPQMGAEDFSAYTDIIPGCFFMIGGGDGDTYDFFNHHPKFKVSEEALLVGSKIHLQIILDLLKKGD